MVKTIFLRFLIITILMSVVCLVYSEVSSAAKKDAVEAEGYALIVRGKKDVARESAIKDAFRRAVEQAIGVLVESETLVKNFELLNDRVYAKSSGYIKTYNIIGEKIDGDSYRVKIKAIVSIKKLEHDLDDIGLLIKKAGNPRLMLLISEQIHDKPTYWWGGEGINIGVSENTLMSKFMDKGFNFVDRQVVLAEIKGDPKLSKSLSPNLSKDIALKLASKGAAEVVIIGQAIAKAGTAVAGTSIRSSQANISVRVINADTGETIASSTTHAAVAHIDPITGSTEALKKASAEMADKLIPQILEKWKKRVTGARIIKLIVSGMNYENVKAFKEFLRENMEDIEDIYDRSFKDGIATLDVEVKGSSKELAEFLSNKKFNNGALKVTSYTSNVIKITHISK